MQLKVQPNRYLPDISSSSEESLGQIEGNATASSRYDKLEVPLKYKNLVKQWVPKELPPIDVDFVVNNRTYHIAPSSLHGLGLFSMDGIIVKYNTVTELMDYVGLCYNYNDWMWLVRYGGGESVFEQ
jgi:hypothetical protein